MFVVGLFERSRPGRPVGRAEEPALGAARAQPQHGLDPALKPLGVADMSGMNGVFQPRRVGVSPHRKSRREPNRKRIHGRFRAGSIPGTGPHEGLGRFRAPDIPGVGTPDRRLGITSGGHAVQNKKYRWASGSSEAGSQVSSSPSALTS